MTLAHDAPPPRDLREAVREAIHLEDHERWDDLARLAAAALDGDVPGGDRDRVTLVIARARAEAKRGYVEAAERRLRDVRGALGALRDDDLAAEWHCAMSAVLFRRGDLHAAASEADDCLRLAHGGRRATFLRAVACQTLGLIARHSGDWPAARRLLHKAIDTFGQCGAETREARAQMNLCSVLVWAGEWDEFEVVARDVLAAAQRLHAPRLAKQVWLQAAMVARGRGQTDRAQECLDRVRQVRPSGQDPRETALAREVEGDLYLDAGDAAAAFAAYDDVVAQGTALALGRDIVFEGLRKRAEAALALGDTEQAGTDAETALAEARADDCVVEVGAALRVLAQVAVAEGDEPRARILAHEAVQTLAHVRERFERARTLVALADYLPDPAVARADAASLARSLAARGLLDALRTGDHPVARQRADAEPRLMPSRERHITPVAVPDRMAARAADGESPDREVPFAGAPLPEFHVRDACVLTDMARVLAHGGDALIEGEAGTETCAIAAELHRRSGRRGRCVVVDAAAQPPDALAALLFGAEPDPAGQSARQGALESAAAGTLIVHNVTSVPAALQGALAHALRARRATRVGAAREYAFEATVFVTSPVRLPVALADAAIARDLGAALQYNRLFVPALRHRPDDLAPTLERAWDDARARWNSQATLAPAARTALLHAPWEGNADELERVVEALVRRAATQSVVRVTDLDAQYAACALRPPAGGLAQQEHEFLVERVLTYLRAAQYNYAQAARLAGYTRSGFLKLVVRLGLKEPAGDATLESEPEPPAVLHAPRRTAAQGAAAM